MQVREEKISSQIFFFRITDTQTDKGLILLQCTQGVDSSRETGYIYRQYDYHYYTLHWAGRKTRLFKECEETNKIYYYQRVSTSGRMTSKILYPCLEEQYRTLNIEYHFY